MKSMIFPWSGRGIFVLAYAAAGIAAGLILGHTLAPRLHLMDEVPLSVAFAQIGLALGTWLFALTMGRSELYTVIVPVANNNIPLNLRTPPAGEPALRRQRHTLFFIPGWIWALLATIFVAVPGGKSLASAYQKQHADVPLDKLVTTETLQKLYASLLQTLHDKQLVANQPAEPARPSPRPEVKAIPQLGVSPALPQTVLPTTLQDWKDNSGRVLTATLERFTTPNYDTAEFRRQDGMTFQVPLARFCAADRAKITDLATRVMQQQGAVAR
jgi:hypothetical protein